jgi:hypothetical protein
MIYSTETNMLIIFKLATNYWNRFYFAKHIFIRKNNKTSVMGHGRSIKISEFNTKLY